MKTLLLATALACLPIVASAQTASTNGRASALAIVNGGSSGSGGASNGRVNNNPDINVPTVYTNNPCGVGASGGLSAGGVGLAFGYTRESDACNRRADAIVLLTAAKAFDDTRFEQWAIGRLCSGEDMRNADTSGLCAKSAPAAVSVQPPPTSTPIKPVVAGSVRPAWCNDGTEHAPRPECR